jgi:hypothetical protein
VARGGHPGGHLKGELGSTKMSKALDKVEPFEIARFFEKCSTKLSVKLFPSPVISFTFLPGTKNALLLISKMRPAKGREEKVAGRIQNGPQT